ncbi:glycosyltransferase family 4 protein [Posidoniimonas polymericola]|uniref:glycosyltransferase family 4 protein n=1 Tax=Posidoniimonas polymericola TaxID=2528002 RepID=UPI0018D43EC0|nr:glycosyltransferase family 1 protein [Posidoniimonas polymericola]
MDFLYRKAFESQFSIESCFARVQEDLSRLGLDNQRVVAPAYSTGFLNRLRILLHAARLSRTRDRILHITGDIYYAAILARAPVSLTIHDLEFINRERGWRRFLLKTIWINAPCARADAITVVSEETKRLLLQTCPKLCPQKVHVIPNSVSDSFKPFPKPAPKETLRILQVGTKPNKNIPLLLQALNGLNCELTIVGPVSEKLRRCVAESDIPTVFKESLSETEMLEVYQDCDLLAFVSLEEGFGMPIVEAQRTLRPVLTSNCSSMPEVAGEGACLVDPRDPASIRAGIERVWKDETYRESLIAKGAANAERFSRGQIADKYLRLFQGLGSQ